MADMANSNFQNSTENNTNGVDLDSWEEIADSGELDKRIEQMKVGNEEDEDFDGPSSRSKSSHGANPLLLEENSRTPYQPQIKLLRRKSGDTGQNQLNSGIQNKPVKSLAERQEEYAKVRERIFGSDNNTSNTDNNTLTTSSNRPQKSVVVSVNTAKKATVSASTGQVNTQGKKR